MFHHVFLFTSMFQLMYICWCVT